MPNLSPSLPLPLLSFPPSLPLPLLSPPVLQDSSMVCRVLNPLDLFHCAYICTGGTKEMVGKICLLGLLPFGKINMVMCFCLEVFVYTREFLLVSKTKIAQVLNFLLQTFCCLLALYLYAFVFVWTKEFSSETICNNSIT